MSYLERIRELREDQDITQKEIAKYLNVAQNTYSQYENGKRELPVSILKKLCQYYQVSADYMLGLSEKSIREVVFHANFSYNDKDLKCYHFFWKERE